MCSSIYVVHTLDPEEQAIDVIAPAQPSAAVARIDRGEAHGGCSATSCDDIATISLVVDSSDDRTTPDLMGWRFTLLDGDLPAGFSLPVTAGRAFDGEIYLSWIDGASDEQDGFAFRLSVEAVDLADNVSTAATVEVSHPGSSAGCTIGGGSSALAAPLLVGVVVLLLLRRRGVTLSAGSSRRGRRR